MDQSIYYSNNDNYKLNCNDKINNKFDCKKTVQHLFLVLLGHPVKVDADCSYATR